MTAPPTPPPGDVGAPATTARRWDVFCQVIDNFGDVGVCWRLCADLARRGMPVRLWIDDASALAWMAPAGCPGVEVRPWPQAAPVDGPGDVVVEAFGCALPDVFVATMAARPQAPLWINLEYLSAEPYVERCHRLASPIMAGPGRGLTRWFYYPGFTSRTGGLLRESDLAHRQATFDRNAWRAAHGLGADDTALLLFCYEPPGLPALLQQLRLQEHWHWCVQPGRPTAALDAALHRLPAADQARVRSRTHRFPTCPQADFDERLWAADLNLVRGEDSLVRALWAGRPLVWHIYPQDDNAHHAKLQAFLDWLQAPDCLREFHAAWNGLTPDALLPAITPAHLQRWQDCVRAARARLMAQADLVTQLLGFVTEKS
ncbi:elongation factor P maturation arginine rhamnosyltransferase EarP [Acidovorax lacteus]|uniref:Protein-arginine rhamnosyltransferase n=1 Tax=Acidovorax lacteus TaxID=1924988 RepID=A0ABP8LGU1_9BURK